MGFLILKVVLLEVSPLTEHSGLTEQYQPSKYIKVVNTFHEYPIV